MDNSWQSKCGSMWPFLTPAVGSSSQVQPQEAQNQMLNAGYHFYSHVGQEPSSSARGIMQEPTFPRTSNLSFHNSGHVELGSSFLSLLSGPPSLLQCDLQQLSNQKPFFTSNIVPVNTNNIMIRAAGSDVSRAPTGLLSQIIDSKNLKTGVDLPQNVSSRAVTREKCASAASLHDVLEAANLNCQNSEVAKAVTHHTVSDNDKMKELSSLRGGWPASPSPSHVRKMHNTHIQSSPSSSIPLQSPPFTSSCPRVFCLGASGDLLLSNTGLLGVVCSCHGLHMSISKFSEHSGLRGVNPGDVVRMDSGETIAQWRKVYFHKFGIRVPEDHSGWDWPEGFSAAAGLVKCTSTMPNITRSSDLSNSVGRSGDLVETVHPWNISFSNTSIKGQKLDNGVLHNGIMQMNAQDGWNFLNGIVGTSGNNVHAIAENQIMNFPISGCSTMSKLVGKRSPDTGPQSISSYVDSISKSENSFISFPNLQNFKPPEKVSHVVRFSNLKEGDIVDRAAVPSNIELRLGQPSQQNRTLGNPVLPSPKSHIIDKHDHLQKSLLPGQPIHNRNSRAMEEYMQYLHFAADTTSNRRREQSNLSLGNRACGVYSVANTCQREEFKGDAYRSFIPTLLSDVKNSSEGKMQYKAANIAVSSSCILTGRVLGESHIANGDTISFSLNRGNGAGTQFSVNEYGIHKDLMKGKGVGCTVDCERVATQSDIGFHSKYKGTLSNSDGLISEIGRYTCSSVLDKSSHPCQLPNVPANTSDVRNPFNYSGTVSRPQHNGNSDHDSLRSFSLPMDSGLTFPSQAVSLGLSRTTSFSVPNVTPTLSTKEGIGVSPHLLNENLRMLALGHILKMSNQDHGMASLLTNQDERRSDYCFGDKMLGSVVDPSTSIECRRGLNLAHKHDAPEVSKTSLNSGATHWMGGDNEKLAPVADLNKWRDFSVISQGTQLHSNIERRCQILCDSHLDEQPSLRLGRSEMTSSPSSGTGKCCQRVPYEYFPGKCCCAVHTSGSSKDCDFKLGTSRTAFREQVESHGSRASMSFASNFDGDSNFPNEKVISVGQSDELKKQESKRVVCHAFQWRDVPNKVARMCNATYEDQPANSFDGNFSERVAAAKCFDRSAQDAESVKDQELSNISSGCSALAITQASVGVDNRESCTVDAQDTRSTSNLVVDEGSGIDILSSDDALDSERSSNFDGFACEINSMDKGSLKASPNQSSRSLIDELRLRDSLRLHRKRNQINTGPTDHEKPNYLQNCEGDSKSDKRKKAKKWKMLDESFHPSGASPAHDECQKCVSSFEQQYGSLDLLRPDHRRFPNCSCSSGTTCKCRRPPLPSSRTSSRERDWHRLYDDREGIDGLQTQLRTNDDCLETHEASHGKMSRSDRPAPIGKEGWVQEPKFTDAELSVQCNSADWVITSSSHQVNVCKRKARPVVCGKYGVISSCDASKPAKILSIRNILKTARRTTLGDNSKLNLSSAKELKKRKNRVSNGSDDKFKEEREKADGDAAVCSKLDADNSERKADSVCFPVGNKHDDASYMLDEERQDRCQQNRTNHNNFPITRSKPKSREVRKRSLYELSTKGKDPNCGESSVVKESNSAVPTQCRYMGKAESYEGHGSDVYSDNKVAGELRCQSISDLHAHCCVCGSSNKDEVNCLLECNQCLIRVHQACYGVAKVPKAHWYCRPCRTGSKNNVCVLCGYGGGAMTLALQSRNIVKGLLKAWNFVTDSLPKNQISYTDVLEGQLNVSTSSSFRLESDSLPVFKPAHIKSAPVAGWKMGLQEQMDSVKSSACGPSNSLVYNSITAGVLDSTVKQWVHMVCGLWTPGTRCPNVNTMSAFDVSGASRPKINVVCSICCRSGGSCIRCRVLGCSIQFHPWCAHQKGLLQSEVEGVDNENVGFYGRCELHAAHHQCNSDSDPADAVTDHPEQKELKCARTEGYKGRKRDGFRHTIPNQSDGVGGCLVPHEQLNAWLHINKQKSCTKGLQKLPASDIEYDCRKEYTRYKQSKGWTSLVVYKSGIHGLGLYTSQFISRGAMVVEYVGEIVGLRVADKRERDYQSGSKLQYKSACYFFRINKENIIDATRKGGIARFVNHSCMPNCVAKVISVRCEKKVVFFAERDIYPGEEITYDYHFNHEDEGKKIPCFCNSKNCRRYLN